MYDDPVPHLSTSGIGGIDELLKRLPCFLVIKYLLKHYKF